MLFPGLLTDTFSALLNIFLLFLLTVVIQPDKREFAGFWNLFRTREFQRSSYWWDSTFHIHLITRCSQSVKSDHSTIISEYCVSKQVWYDNKKTTKSIKSFILSCIFSAWFSDQVISNNYMNITSEHKNIIELKVKIFSLSYSNKF